MKSSKEKKAKRPPAESDVIVRRHLKFGWYSLLVFLSLGLILEALHGLKAPIYLNVSNETRRLMWTLAHAHGTLFGLLNLGLVQAVVMAPSWAASRRQLASTCLLGATILMPAGFFLAGWFIQGGDPGLPVILVPVGGLLLLVSVFLTARAVQAESPRGKV